MCCDVVNVLFEIFHSLMYVAIHVHIRSKTCPLVCMINDKQLKQLWTCLHDVCIISSQTTHVEIIAWKWIYFCHEQILVVKNINCKDCKGQYKNGSRKLENEIVLFISVYRYSYNGISILKLTHFLYSD